MRTKNLPYSLEEIKRITSGCSTCAEFKPRYYKPVRIHLIKATQSYERIKIDFKGPLPSSNGNHYFLNVVVEYSRFPFVFPCPDVSTSTVIKCLTALFAVFGNPAYVHSDRGASFLSNDLCTFLRERGIASSRTTSHNPEGNGQVERYNGVIWKAIAMTLKTKNISVKYWQEVLPDCCMPHGLFCAQLQTQRHMKGFLTSLAAPLQAPPFLRGWPLLIKRHVRSSKQIHWWKKLSCLRQTHTLPMYTTQMDERQLFLPSTWHLQAKECLQMLKWEPQSKPLKQRT